MAAHTLPGIGLTGGRSSGEDGWATEMNLNLLLMSSLGQLTAKSRVTALPGSPVDGDIYIVPSPDNRVAVRDAGAWTYFTPFTGCRAWVVNEGQMCLFNGTAWTGVPAPVSIGTFRETAPTASQILLDWVFADATVFPDDFAGSVASVGTNPAATFTASVQKNGSAVGSLVIATSGAATFATTGTTVSFTPGDVLTIVAPGSADASIGRLRVTLKGIGAAG